MPPPCERLGNVLGNYLQRGVVVGPLFETGGCAHKLSLIVVDGAIIDVHSATLNVNASTL